MPESEDTAICPITGEKVCFCEDVSGLTGDHTEHRAALDLVKPSDATHEAVNNGSWFDPATWAGGTVPGDDAKVYIPKGVSVTYDAISEARIETLGVCGELSFSAEVSSKLVVDTVVVAPGGRLEAGTAENPIDGTVTVDIVIADNGDIDTTWDPQLMSRGIVSLGEVEMHGAEKISHLKAATDPMAGDTSLTLAEAPEGWAVGDTLVIAGTQNDGWGWDGSKSAYRGDTNEVVTVTAIDGNTITFDPPLSYDHPSPRDDLKTSVANYSRSITIESESGAESEVHHRGHVMFMGSDDVDVRFVAFDELGRTDKSERSVPAGSIAEEDLTADANVQGRYGIHLHRLGTEDVDNPAVLEGNAVFGSPGWGIAHHSSNAVLHQNATYNTYGAGFVAEKGDEIGVWSGNIAIDSQGENRLEKDADDVNAFDLARTGSGYWFQGRMVEAHDNIAASTNTGYVWMTRGATAPVDPLLADQPEALAVGENVGANIPVINNFSGNETFGSARGLVVIKANPNQGHDLRTVMEDFTAWEVRDGAHLEYTSHYTLIDFDIVGLQDPPRFTRSYEGISFGTNTSDMVIVDASIDGFRHAYSLSGNFTDDSVNPSDTNQYVIVGGTLTNIGKTTVKQDDPDSHDFDGNWSGYVDFLESGAVGQGLSQPLVAIDPLSVSYDARNVIITGTKTDSLGDIPLAAGTDTYSVTFRDVRNILEQDGYYTLGDKEVFVVEVYYQDRFTAEIVKHGYIVEAEAGTLSNQYGVFNTGTSNGAFPEFNQAPVAAGESAVTTQETPVIIDLLSNDTDPDGDALRVDGIIQSEHGRITDVGDGTVRYTPDFDFTGTDTFSYWITDGFGEFVKAEVSVAVGESDGPPTVSPPPPPPVSPPPPTTSPPAPPQPEPQPQPEPVPEPVPEPEPGPLEPSEPIVAKGNKNANVMIGGENADMIKGKGGDDQLTGAQGDDALYGGRGRDTLGGGEGVDLIRGGGGHDTVSGGTGDDTLYGNRGRDTVQGGDGNDTIYGNGGADTLGGGNGDDTIVTGRGRDVVNGGEGDDTIILGKGAKTVVFDESGGEDRVVGFNRKNDLLDLSAYFEENQTVEEFVAARATQEGDDIRFSFDDGSSLLIENANLEGKRGSFFTEDNMITADDIADISSDDGV